MKNSIAIFLFSVLVVGMSVYAQTMDVNNTQSHSYGAYGNYNWNYHDADYMALPGTAGCCKGFNHGYGSGVSFGAQYQHVLTDALSLVIRTGYFSYSATFIRRETQTSANPDLPLSGIELEQELQSTLSSIGIEAAAKYRIYGELNMLGGFRVGFVSSRTGTCKETILGNGVYISGGKVWEIYSGDLPEAYSIQLSALAGVSYDFPLNSPRSLYLSPEIIYSHGIIPILKGSSWYGYSIRAGFSIRATSDFF